MMNDEYKPINRDNLDGVVSKLKTVLNPIQWLVGTEENRLYFKMSTDLSSLTDVAVLINGITDSNKVIIFNGYLSQGNITGINTGSLKIKCLGYYFENQLLQILIGVENPNSPEETDSVKKLLAEVFIVSDTKNHCTQISTLDEFPIITEYVTAFAEENNINWEFKIVGNLSTDDPSLSPRQITINPNFSSVINKIQSAETADKLTNNITFNVSGTGVESTSSTLDFENDPESVDLSINVDTQAIENYIDVAIAGKSIQAASTEVLGGFRQHGGTGSPVKLSNLLIVRMDHTDNYHYAYVDANDILRQDVHRYTDMTVASVDHHNFGEIVQYIGDTTSLYIHGYFYMRVREFLQGTIPQSGTNWRFINSVTGQSDLNAAVTEYNRQNDHLLVTNKVLTLTPDVSTIESNIINDDTVFHVVNDNFISTITYSDIKDWGIELTTLTYDDQNPLLFTATITLSYIDDINESNPPVWILKNVLPSISVDSPLVYKGIIESETGETDIEALERQVTNPKQGWVYTVTPSKQEYFWNGEEWEYMGQLIDVPEYIAGDAIDINSSNEISVLYDSASILTGDSGLLVSPELYVSGNDNISVEEKDEDFRAISVLGYKWDPDQKSFAEGKFSSSLDSPAQGSYSHTEGRNTKTDGLASHAEGYYTFVLSKASHAEGFGILFNTGSTGFSWTTEDVSYGDLEIEIDAGSSQQYEAPGKTALTLIKELNFINEYSLHELELYSRDTKESVSFNVARLTIDGDLFNETYTYDPDHISYCRIYLNVDDVDKLGSSGILDIIVPVYANAQSSHAEGKNTQVIGKNAHVEGLVNKVEGENSHAEGHMNYINGDGYNAHAEGYNTRALKNQAHSEGANTQAYGENSHVEGEETCAWGKDSHAEGKSSNSPALFDETYFNDSLDNVYSAWKNSQGYQAREYACAWAQASHIEGKDNLTVGNNSHAEGQDTCAYGAKSHAEGSNTLAKGNNSHAEGDDTDAIGMSSHAEGYFTKANGNLSHAEGWATTANNQYEHAEGYYNVSHKASNTYGSAGNTQHSIGINNKNALEIMQNGEMYVLNVGGYDGVHIKSETGYENTKTLQDVLGTIPSNTLTGVTFNGTSATVSGGVASITASVGDTNVIETVKINGTALTPDSNKSVDITVFSGSGNSHAPGLVPDPGATSGSSKYLCEDGTWSAPADSDTTYTFTEGNTDGAFSVIPSGGSASSVTVHNVLKTTGGTMTGQVYHTINSPTISSNTVTITCDKKYNWVTLLGGTLALTIMPSSLAGPCEVICAVKNTDSSNSLTLTLPSSTSTVHNMIGENSFTIGPNKIAEIVFTFWSTTDVSFNGGVEQ